MGGNALKNVTVRRLTMSELRRVQDDFKLILEAHKIPYSFPRELPEKESFGDVDILVKPVCSAADFLAWIMTVLAPTDIAVHGPVHSLAYENMYQVDLILCENLEMSSFFYSFGDTGAILGRMCSKHELKYGNAGLAGVASKILLSEDPVAICAYLRLSYEAWEQGFDTQVALMEWITTCRLAKAKVFESRKSSDRHNRPFYLQFREYFASLTSLGDEEEGALVDLERDAIAYFCKVEELEAMEEAERARRELKAKFHGGLFVERGVEPRQVRTVMSQFLEHHDVKPMTKEEIEQAIECYLLTVQKQS